VKYGAEPASDSSLEGITSSPSTLLNNPEDKSRTGRGESEKKGRNHLKWHHLTTFIIISVGEMFLSIFRGDFQP
jgi:hypothetical protein